jgi:hypothetical protein
MTFRSYLIIMTFVSLCAWIGWIVVIHTVDPFLTGFIGLVLFYLTLWVATLSSLTLFGTVIRVWLDKNDVVYRQVTRSLRQAILLSGLLLVVLFLLSKGLLVWWVIVLLIGIVSFIELIFIGQKTST